MATRRRLANPTGPQPVTQVVASPVDTTVTPGSAGAPAAPAPLPVPVQDPQAASVDLNNLAQAFGSLSSSLSNLGASIDRRERREQADLDRAQRLMDRAQMLRERGQEKEAKEAEDLAEKALRRISIEQGGELTPINKLKPQFDKYVEEGKMYLTEHPAFKEAMAVGLATRYAIRDTESDSLELDGILRKKDDEILNPQYFTKWFSSRTTTRTENVPDWITDKDAYISTYSVTRGDLSIPLRRRFMRDLGEMQKGIEATNLTEGISKIMSSSRDSNDLTTTRFTFDYDKMELTESEDQTAPVDSVALTVQKIEALLADQSAKGVAITDKTSQSIVGSALLKIIDSVQIDPENPGEARDEIEFGIKVLKSIEVGEPGNKKRLLGDSELGIEFRKNNGVLEKANAKLFEIAEAEKIQVFEQGVQRASKMLNDKFVTEIELNKLPLTEGATRLALYLDQTLNPAELTVLGEEDKEFAGFIESLGGSFNPATRTLTLKTPDGSSTITKTVDEIAKEAKQEIIRDQFAAELETIKSKAASDPEAYKSFSGEPLSDQALTMIALARVVRRNNFSEEEGIRSFVNDKLTFNPGGTLDERADNLQSTLYVYRELVSDQKSNPLIAQKVLGKQAYSTLQFIDEAVKGNISLQSIAESIGKGRFDDAFISQSFSANKGKIRDDIEEAFEFDSSDRLFPDARSTKLKALNNFYYKDGPSALFRAKELTGRFVVSLGMPLETAIEKSIDIVTKDAVKIGEYFYQPSMFSESALTGAHPSMALNPVRGEDNTPENQKRKLQEFSNAKREYDSHYESFAGAVSHEKIISRAASSDLFPAIASFKNNPAFTAREDGSITYSKEYRKWRSKLFDLENKLRVSEGLEPKKYSFAALFPNSADLRRSGKDWPLTSIKKRHNPALETVTIKFSNMKLVQMMELANRGLNEPSEKFLGKDLYARFINSFEDVEDIEDIRFVPDVGRGSDTFVILYKNKDGIDSIVSRADATSSFSMSEVASVARNVYHSGGN